MYRCIVHFSSGERKDRLVDAWDGRKSLQKIQCQTEGRQKMLVVLDRILKSTAAARDSLVTSAKRPPHTKPPMGSFHSKAIIVGRTKDMKMAVGTDHIDRSVSVNL